MKNNSNFLLPIRCVLFIGVFVSMSLLTGNAFSSLSKWWSVVVTAINIITISILLFTCKKTKTSYSQLIGYKKGSTKASAVVIMSVLILFVGMGGMYFAGFLCYGKFPYMAVMMIEPIPLILAIINVLILPLTTTLAEDGLYLGLGVNQIKNKWCAIFIPAFFYALQHSFIPLLPDFTYIAYRFLSFLPLTVLMCWLYYKKRNPVPFMVGHFIINLATVSQIVMTSASPEVYNAMLKM